MGASGDGGHRDRRERSPRRRRIIRVIRVTAGGAMVLTGVAGLALPVIPGVALVVGGIMLMAPNTRLAKWLRRAAGRLARAGFRRRRGVSRTPET
jgi:uncharacterized membrane protein YbaN (DUF454 family)